MNVEITAAQIPASGSARPTIRTEIQRALVFTPAPTRPTRKNRGRRGLRRVEMAMRRCVVEATERSLWVPAPGGMSFPGVPAEFSRDERKVLDDRAAGDELALSPLEIIAQHERDLMDLWGERP